MTVEAILSRQTAMREAVRAKVTASLARQWTNLGSWDEADVARLTARVVPLVRAGQLSTAASTDAYLAQVVAEITGEPAATVGVPAARATDLRPVPAQEVYRRPFVEVWSALKSGHRFSEALSIGADRLTRLAEDDLNLAHRHAANYSLETRGIVTYRRVTRPEFSRSGSCALCGLASQQTYHTGRLLPIHTRCGCDVLPVIGSADPAARLNAEDAHDIPDGFDVVVHEHGELGPVLAVAGQHFDLAA